MRLYSNLIVCTLTPEQNQRTCNYWYVVTTGAMSHTAFETRTGFDRWMAERGLSISGELPSRGEHSVHRIVGSYIDNMMWDKPIFDSLPGKRTRVLSNGDYTQGVLTRDQDNLVVVNYLNPNVQDRVKYNYFDSRDVMN